MCLWYGLGVVVISTHQNDICMYWNKTQSLNMFTTILKYSIFYRLQYMKCSDIQVQTFTYCIYIYIVSYTNRR